MAPLGRPTARTISGDTANGTTTFAYDALDRLTTYTPPSVISPQAYTWNGQPDRASIQTGTGTPLTVTFDAAGRPTTDSSSGTYSSDDEGRITAVPGRTMTYDALGRLTQVVGGSSTANYTYDALDRLRTINVGSATNRFRYVGTTDAVAQILDNVALTVLVNHATDLDGTELFDFAPGGSSQVYLGRNDHGDVTWSATTTGAVSARVSYDPYGNVAASSGTTPASRWQGSYYDSTSGFYYVNARWFAPSLGTFLSEDPLDHEITDPASRDEYAYGSGDPIDKSDPTGECTMVYEGGGKSYCETFPNPLPVPFFSQHWYPDQLTPTGSSCTETIDSHGCLVTSFAMVLGYYRNTVPGVWKSFDPRQLVNWANDQHKGLIGADNCNFNSTSGVLVSRLGIRLQKKSSKFISHWAYVPRKTVRMVDGELAAGRPVVAHVVWGKGHDHWVVIVGRWSDTTTAKRWHSNALWKYPTSEFQTVTGSTGHYKATWGDWLIRDPNKSSADPKGQEQRLFSDDASSRGLSQPKKSSHYAIVGLFAVRRS